MQFSHVLVGALLAVAGGAFVVRATRALALYDRVRAWSTAPGVVIRSELQEATDGDGTSYRTVIACSYRVGGAQYTTSRHTDGGTFEHPEASARALLSAFPVGWSVELRVDPSAPQRAVLVTGMPQHMVVIRRVGHAAVIAGIGLALHGLVQQAAG